MTVREIAALYPAHAWHTVVSVERMPLAARLHCNCGARLLVVEQAASLAGWRWREVDARLAMLPAPEAS